MLFSPALRGDNAFKVVRGMQQLSRAPAHRRFVLVNDVLCFRGTVDWADLLRECQVGKSRWVDGGSVHRGFYTQYALLRDEVHRCISGHEVRLVAGHSLGGVLAVLFAHDLKRLQHTPHAVYTFGAPRIGDCEFASLSRDWPVYRVQNTRDLVPSIPPYCFHVGQLVSVSFNGKQPLGSHCIDRYTNELRMLSSACLWLEESDD